MGAIDVIIEYMKKIINTLTILSITFALLSCGSTPVEEEVVEQAPVAVIEDVPEEIPEPIVEPDSVEEVVLVVEETPEVDEEEYERSTKNVNSEEVSKAQFAKDKAEILNKIEELQIIMDTKDFTAWLDYIAPESKEFYATPKKIWTNLGIKVNNGLEQYFTDIFIPARKKSFISEIRYNSPVSIKAVQVNGPGNITTYYNFVKIVDQWLVELPTEIALKKQ